MKALVLAAPGRFEIVERPRPVPAPGEVLLRVLAAGICGADLHAYHGTHSFYTYPRVIGHEIAAEVVEVGPGVNAALLGRRVGLDQTITCGHCYPCRHGRPNCCVNLKARGVHIDGGFCEYIAVPADHLYPVPDSLGVEETALLEPLTIGCQATWRGDVSAGEKVVVIGAGPIGLACLLAARDLGARVLVADLLDSRLALAAKLGADRLVNSGRESLAAAVESFTDGDGAGVVIEAVGVDATLKSAVDAVASSGRVVLLGFADIPLGASLSLLIRKEIDVRASRLNTGQFPRAIELAVRQRAVLPNLVSHRFPLAEATAAFDLLAHHPEQTCKVLLVP